MDTENGFAQLVRQAQLGDRISLDRLAEGARQRLYAYIYRLTLNHDLAQDLLQETLLKMVESIKELEHPDRFWSWLFRTALGTVQHYYRDLAREQAVEFSSVSRKRLSDYLSEDHEGRQELETAFRLMAAKYLGSEVETLDVPLSAPSSEISVVVRHFLPLNSASREAEGARFDEPASSR